MPPVTLEPMINRLPGTADEAGRRAYRPAHGDQTQGQNPLVNFGLLNLFECLAELRQIRWPPLDNARRAFPFHKPTSTQASACQNTFANLLSRRDLNAR